MFTKKIFLRHIFACLFVLGAFFAPTKICCAYDGEYTYEAGMTWYITTPGTVYELSDYSLGEVLEDGNLYKVRLKRPGDLYVTTHRRGLARSRVYLIHIVGTAVDETAVDGATYEKEVLHLVNIERRKVGARPLTLAQDLHWAAMVRAQELTRRFSHTRPDGTPFHTVLIKGENYTLGENVAVGQTSPKQVVADWMDSPGHRRNILRHEYRELGVGYYYQNNSKYHHHWVQIFRR